LFTSRQHALDKYVISFKIVNGEDICPNMKADVEISLPTTAAEQTHLRLTQCLFSCTTQGELWLAKAFAKIRSESKANRLFHRIYLLNLIEQEEKKILQRTLKNVLRPFSPRRGGNVRVPGLAKLGKQSKR